MGKRTDRGFSVVVGVSLAAALTLAPDHALDPTAFADDDDVHGSIRIHGDHLEELATMDPEQAKARVLATLASASVDDSDLEVVNGFLVYEVELVLGVRRIELELVVDAGNGEILAVDNDDDDDDDE